MLSLEFASNMFGSLKPEIKKRLQKVIDKPTQRSWEDTYTIILSNKGRMLTLWQAVLHVDPSFARRKGLNDKWEQILKKETIERAIKYAVFEFEKEKELN